MFRKAIKKTAAALIAGVVVIGLAACSKEVPLQTEVQNIKGTEVDAGQIKATCPEWWASVGVPDVNSSDATTLCKDKLRFVKGEGTEESIMTNAYLEIWVVDDANAESFDPAERYDDVATLQTFTTGDYSWDGYTGTVMGVPFARVTASTDEKTYVAMLYMNTGAGSTASIFDDDVIATLASIDKD